ncbi:MAG TPA: hypothetical protein VMF53_12585, partial [Alphaproteobacteria bacterium]|nr:hypothetical protein [Alphaproteobacteria bacterium]
SARPATTIKAATLIMRRILTSHASKRRRRPRSPERHNSDFPAFAAFLRAPPRLARFSAPSYIPASFGGTERPSRRQ